MPPVPLTARELAGRLDARYDDVLSWARRGVIPSIKSGGVRYFILDQVLRALRERAAVEPARTEEAATT